MVRAVRLQELPAVAAAGWRVVEGELRLKLGDDEIRLQCTCGRCHWILRSRPTDERGVLAVMCHSCGARGEIPLERYDVPPAIRE
jgi:hypothetical protein